MILDFIGQLVASAIGAGIGAVAVYFVFRAERNERELERLGRQDERFETALAELMTAMWEYPTARITWGHRNRFVSTPLREAPQTEPAPSDTGIRGKLEVARMLADADERRVMGSLARLVKIALTSDDLPLLRDTFENAVTGIREWRSREINDQTLIDRLDKAHRKLARPS